MSPPTGHPVSSPITAVRARCRELMQSVVDDPQGLSAQWLSEVLQATGHPFTVSDVQFERVGTGQMGTTYRLNLAYEGLAGPPTLIAKLAGEDQGTRAMVAPGYAARWVSTRGWPQASISELRGAWRDRQRPHTLHLAARRLVPGHARHPGPGMHRRASRGIATNLGRIAHSVVGRSELARHRCRPRRPDAAMMAQVMSQACETFMSGMPTIWRPKMARPCVAPAR